MTIGANALQILASCVPGQDISAVLAGMPAGIRDPRCSTTVRAIKATTAVRRFAPRRYQCSPDREASRNRRGMLARGRIGSNDEAVAFIHKIRPAQLDVSLITRALECRQADAD